MLVQPFSTAKEIISSLAQLDREIFGESSWEESNFIQDRPRKEELSLLLSDGEQIVGYIVGYETNSRIVHISRLGLSESYRGEALGGRMIQEFFEHASSLGYDHVTVEHPTDLPVAPFYEKSGFLRLSEKSLVEYVERMEKDPVPYLNQERLVYQFKLS